MYILSHTNPDGDAIGASFGIAALLNVQNTVVFYGTKPFWFDTLVQELQPKTRYVWNTTVTPQPIHFRIDDYIHRIENGDKPYHIQCNNDENIYHNILVVDANSASRSGLSGYTPVMIIDHHKDEQDKAWINISAPGISSTCEIITSFLTNSSPVEITGEIHQAAPWLMLGIITDTLGLRINVTKETLDRLSFLCEYTNAFGAIQQILNTKKPKYYIHTIKQVLNTYKEIRDDTAFVTMNTEDKNQVASVMELLRKYYSNVFIVYRQEKCYALSARTENDLAYKVAKKFGGGGHPSAAGAVTTTTPDEIERIIQKTVDA